MYLQSCISCWYVFFSEPNLSSKDLNIFSVYAGGREICDTYFQ